MLHLYVNNFRGFRDTLLSLKDANFFVGENSTGKTSLLALIQLVTTVDFWQIWPEFNTENYEFGYFEEIADKNFESGKLTIGFFHSQKGMPTICFKAILINADGLPKIESFYYSDGECVYLVTIKKKAIYAQYMKQRTKMTESVEWFSSWLKEIQMTTQWSQKKHMSKTVNLPIVLLMSLIHMKLNKNGSAFNAPEGLQAFMNETCWMAPVRAKPQRVYSLDKGFSPEGEHTPFLLSAVSESAKKTISDFGQSSGLFDKIEIKKFGREKKGPFVVMVNLNGKTIRLSNVGYGVAQVLPLITEIIARQNNCKFLFQQPEVHLHPKAQAEFGEFVYWICKNQNKTFIIETHSDFVIDRFRVCLNRDNEKTNSAQVIYFERTEEGNHLTQVEILPDGRYSEEQPQGFREFFLNEGLRLLEV